MNEDFEEFFEDELQDSGITKGQLVFITYIGGHPDCTPTELAENVKADSGYTARSIKKLVDAGLAQKRQHEADRRAYLLSLTELGMVRFRQCQLMQEKWENRVCEELDAVERQMLMQLLEKIGLF